MTGFGTAPWGSGLWGGGSLGGVPFTQDQYSRRATRDVRGAMALALRRHLEGLMFHNPAPITFAEVFEEWPSFNERFIPPAACILPGAWKYDDALFTPSLLEDTWEPAGESGFGLYKLNEISMDFEVLIRCVGVAERNVVVLGVEESFRAPLLLMDAVNGARNAIIVDMPEYYGLTARFSLLNARILDDEDRALREARDAIFTISAQAAQVAVGPVQPLCLTIHLDPRDP
jgi:hypothetical protein